MSEGKKFCPAIWFSGFLALGFLAHLLRLVLQVPLSVWDKPVPMSTSVMVVIVFGALSTGLLIVGLKRPCGGKKTVCGS
jgi:hypothetical protein